MESLGASSRLYQGAPKDLRRKKKPGFQAKNKAAHPAPILRLPPELVLLIVELLDVKDQAALGRTNCAYYRIINPLIYANDVKLGNASCLFWAARCGQLGTLNHALEAGADINDHQPYEASKPAENTTEPVAGSGNPATRSGQLVPSASPLHLAAKEGHREVVDWMLDHGARIDAPSFRLCECQALKPSRHPLRRADDWPAWSALHLALCHEERSVAELLIFRGASLKLDAGEAGRDVPEEPSYRAHTALHSASANGLLPVIKLLALDINFDVNQRDATENTALHYVANLWTPRDSPEIRDTITKLLALGAELEAHNEMGHTPLLNACYRGNYAVANRLVNIGANPEPHATIPDFRDFRPLYYCMLPRSEFFDLDEAPVKHDEFEGNRVSLINALIEAGADVDAPFDKRGYRSVTALMLACELAEPRAIAALIKGGASVNAQDRNGRTPLLYACAIRVEHRAEVPEIATLLLRHGARIDLEDDPNSTLEWAMKHVRWGESDILEVMLKVANWVNLTRPKLKAALRKCASNGNLNALKPLLQFADRTYGVTKTELKQYLDLNIENSEHWNQRETFNYLMNFATAVESNETLLLKTIMHRNRELSLAVLQRGVAVSESRFYGGETFLHLACRWGDEEVIKALLERAAEVNVFDDELRTPLSIVVVENHYSVADLLMIEVADPHLVPDDELFKKLYPDDEEWRFVKRRYLTAFDLAIRENRVAILETMLARYNLPEIPLGTAFTYIHRACQNPNTNILAMLLNKGADASGGPGCPNPPFVSLLRDIWSRQSTPQLAASALRAAKLLRAHMKNVDASNGVILEIVLYDGPDADRKALRKMVMRELNIVIVKKGDGQYVGW